MAYYSLYFRRPQTISNKNNAPSEALMERKWRIKSP